MKTHRFILFFFIPLCLSTGCLSLNDYAVKYDASTSLDKPDAYKDKSTKGTQIEEPQQSVAESCHYYRNQLVVASQEAQTHLWWVWAFPGYWPLHILTFYMLPIDETRIANKVIAAAQKMERAYQTNDTQFLNTCEQLFVEPELGPAFAQENPFLEDN